MSLLKLQCYNIWLNYIIVVNLAVWMQPHRQINIATLSRSHSRLPDYGDHTETCWSYRNFNVNFNTPLKTSLLCATNSSLAQYLSLCGINALTAPLLAYFVNDNCLPTIYAYVCLK